MLSKSGGWSDLVEETVEVDVDCIAGKGIKEDVFAMSISETTNSLVSPMLARLNSGREVTYPRT